MKAISDVIAELVHAANIAARLSDAERLLLLNRTYVTLHEGNVALLEAETLGYPDILNDIAASIGMVADLSDDEFKTLLLEGAQAIQTMKCKLDAKRAREERNL